MSMFNDISCDRYDNKEQCLANAKVVKVLARKFGVGQRSFIGPSSEKKWYSAENSPQRAWDHIEEEMLLEFAESGHPIFRATTPLSRSNLKSKGRRKLSIHFAADYPTIETVFRIIVSANQLSIYGAVATICEEFESHHDGSGEPEILMGQSIVLGEIKAEVPLQNEDSMNHQILWQQYIERIESLSPESKVSRFCKEARFMRVVEVGQYFVTKDTGDFRQFRSVACREYTLPRDDPASEAKRWIQGNMRIGPVLEVTSSFQHFKYGIEIRVLVSESRQFSILGGNILWNDRICGRINSRQHRNSCRSTRRGRCTNKLRSGCSQVKGKSKTSTENSLGRQQPYQYMKENGLTLSHQHHLSLHTKSRRK